jgi:carboxyl-terminal processing protease
MGKYYNYVMSFTLIIALVSAILLKKFYYGSFANEINEKQQKEQEQFYYNSNLLSQVISEVRTAYYKDVEVEDLINKAIKGLMENLDNYSTFMDNQEATRMRESVDGEFAGLGFVVTKNYNNYIKIMSVIDGTPASKANLKIGDIIDKIDGVSVLNISLEDAIKKMKGKKDTSVTLTILKKDKSLDIKLIRDIIKVPSVKNKMLENNIGYINITSFDKKIYSEMVAAISTLKEKNMQYLILDLRDDPGGLLDQAILVSDSFLDSGEIVSIKPKNLKEYKRYMANKGDILRDIPIYVIINENTASAAEIVTAALKDNSRATIIGTKSFGKGSVQQLIPVGSKGEMLKMTIALYYTPAGVSIHEKGIEPDVYVYKNGMFCDKCSKEKNEHMKKDEFIYSLLEIEKSQKNDSYKPFEKDLQLEYVVKYIQTTNKKAINKIKEETLAKNNSLESDLPDDNSQKSEIK